MKALGMGTILAALLSGPGEVEKVLDCHVVFAPQASTTEGSGYTAIVAAADGRVFLGSARYGGYGWLLELYPRTRTMKKIADLQEITGERLSGIHTQAKIHSKMSIGSDGKLYFASKQGHEVFATRPEFEDPAGYPGGHLSIYDSATGKASSLGIPVPREGLLWAILDEARGRVYLKSEPRNHFLYYDLASGLTADRGNLGAASRYMALDPRGVVYTIGREGFLCRYDPAKDYLEDLPVEVEGEGSYRSPYVIAIAPGGQRLYGLSGGGQWVMEFDLQRAGERVAVRNVATVIGGGLPNRDIHAAVFGKDGRLYFPVLTEEPAKGEVIHLIRFDPTSRTVEDLGVPRPVGHDDAAHRHVYVRGDTYRLDYIQGAAVGPDGTLYLMDIYPQLNVAIFPRLTASP